MREEEDDAALVGLLAELRDSYGGLRNHISYGGTRLDRLFELLASPRLPKLRYDLPFHVEQWDDKTIIRLVSANATLFVAIGAFETAVKEYPNSRWLLRDGARNVREYEPTSR